MTGSVEEPGRWPGSLSPFQIAMEVVVPIYRLGSNELVHAPGVVAWAINGYHFKRDRAVLRRVIVDGWPGVPDHAAQQLLSGAAPYHVDGDTVVFTVDDPPLATPVAKPLRRPTRILPIAATPRTSMFMSSTRPAQHMPSIRALICATIARLVLPGAMAVRDQHNSPSPSSAKRSTPTNAHWNSIRRSRTP